MPSEPTSPRPKSSFFSRCATGVERMTKLFVALNALLAAMATFVAGLVGIYTAIVSAVEDPKMIKDGPEIVRYSEVLTAPEESSPTDDGGDSLTGLSPEELQKRLDEMPPTAAGAPAKPTVRLAGSEEDWVKVGYFLPVPGTNLRLTPLNITTDEALVEVHGTTADRDGRMLRLRVGDEGTSLATDHHTYVIRLVRTGRPGAKFWQRAGFFEVLEY